MLSPRLSRLPLPVAEVIRLGVNRLHNGSMGWNVSLRTIFMLGFRRSRLVCVRVQGPVVIVKGES